MVVGIIPARMASTRFPGKPLVKIQGHSMIEHVYRRSMMAKTIDKVYIATCDDEIANAAKGFNAEVIMTSTAHTRGTDRVAEAAEKVQADIIINIQGDEPFIDPDSLDASVALMENNEFQCLNWITPINEWGVFISQNTVKTVIDNDNKILYFSRQPIPSSCEGSLEKVFKQMGVYLFRKDFLLQYASWPETPLEIAEKVDMLRILEQGFSIKAFITKDMIGVDVPEDVSIVEELLVADTLCSEIFK